MDHSIYLKFLTKHVLYLEKARSFGDFLVVGLNSDASVRRIKGGSRPINDEMYRSLVLSSLSSVDYVVIFDQDTPEILIHELIPDILVKGADWPEEKIIGSDFVKSQGGTVQRVEFEIDLSTTDIIKKVIAPHRAPGIGQGQ